MITCVDPKKLEPSLTGRQFDKAFLESLPANVDPCGENEEFHTFVYDAPIFKKAIPVKAGELVLRDGFKSADLTVRVLQMLDMIFMGRTRARVRVSLCGVVLCGKHATLRCMKTG